MKYFTRFLLFAILLALAFYAPHYLTYADTPIKSDVVLLLIGPGIEARAKEALQLMTERCSDYMVISAYGKILKISDGGALVSTRQNPSIINNSTSKRTDKHEFPFYEDTHLEVRYAKAMMDEVGFKSANFVSSPYHMRRVKLIADRVFAGGNYNLSFVPSRYEETHKNLWWLNKYDLKWVLSEYSKIIWFLLYEPFCE